MIERYLDDFPDVNPSAFVHGAASVIGEVRIGAEASIWPHAVLRGDDGAIRIGDRTNIQDGCILHADGRKRPTVVGSQVTVGHGVILHGCEIADNCLIGMGSIVIDHAVLGEWCFVGAGTLITHRTVVPPRSLVIGRPGRVVRQVTDEEIEAISYGWQRYVQMCGVYRDTNA